MLTGAVAASVGFFDQLFEQVPAWRVAWDRATPIAMSKTIGGYRLTVERAYADAANVMIGVSVTPLNGAPGGVLDDISLTSASGAVVQGDWVAAGGDASSAKLLFFRWSDPAVVTSANLTLTVADLLVVPEQGGAGRFVNGPWRFSFDVPITPDAIGSLEAPE